MRRLMIIGLVVALSVSISAAESPVADAAARGDRETVKSLLKQAADVNAAQGDGMAAAVSGTIKRIVSDKGFGFVAADDGTEYFFHNSAVQGTRFDELREGQKVTFEKGQGPKGPRAENVRPS